MKRCHMLFCLSLFLLCLGSWSSSSPSAYAESTVSSERITLPPMSACDVIDFIRQETGVMIYETSVCTDIRFDCNNVEYEVRRSSCSSTPNPAGCGECANGDHQVAPAFGDDACPIGNEDPAECIVECTTRFCPSAFYSTWSDYCDAVALDIDRFLRWN